MCVYFDVCNLNTIGKRERTVKSSNSTDDTDFKKGARGGDNMITRTIHVNHKYEILEKNRYLILSLGITYYLQYLNYYCQRYGGQVIFRIYLPKMFCTCPTFDINL